MSDQKQLVVIDYGMGNIHSVVKAVETVAPDITVTVSNDPEVILNASHVILPGVGAIKDCIAAIKDQKVDQSVKAFIQSKKPLLGICIGMQVLLSHSEENGGVDCLGHFNGNIQRFSDHMTDDAGHQLKVPHMGWNRVKQTSGHPMWQGIKDNSRFYFVHSYFLPFEDSSQVAGTCEFPDAFSCSLQQDNVFATQFHPEKSAQAGLKLLENFINWDGKSQSAEGK